MRRLALLALVAFLLVPTSLHAATFLVADDATLVTASRAIVIGTAGASHGRWAPGGWIETVTTIQVDETIKGDAGGEIEVVELGGLAGGIGYAVAGSAQFTAGERVLLFLESNDRGDWVPKNMSVGKFGERVDASGHRLLLREAVSINGWDLDGAPHVERTRDAAAFVRYVRAVARGERPQVDYFVGGARMKAAEEVVPNAAAAAASTYLIQSDGGLGHLGIRWQNATAVFLSHGSQPGAVNGGVTSAQRGLAAWTGAGAAVSYTYGGTTTIASSGFGSGRNDGVNTIQFNDPSDEIPGSFTGTSGDTLAIGGAWFNASNQSDTHTYAGERFYTIVEADLVVQNGITGPGLTGNGFDHILTHELGHTLGLRHSDTPPAGGTSTSSAIMNSSVAFNSDPFGSSLQAWDREAIGAVYGSAAPPCTPPSITTQPAPSSIAAGGSAILTVAASGDAPLQYQWYVGKSGNTSQPVSGGAASSIAVSPHATTTYWARVTNACPPPADSQAATVTVNGCAAVSIDTQSPNVTILQGKSTTLTIAASSSSAPLTIQWFKGASGTTTAPIAGATGASLVVTPAVTTSYWARATNACGAAADSDTIVVTVTPCTGASIAAQPVGGDVLTNTSATLYAPISGSAPLTIQWYEGLPGDTTHPAPNGTGPTLVTPPLLASTRYWVRATNDCGAADSTAAMVNIVTTCASPVVITPPASMSVPGGTSTKLTVAVTGTSLTYQWYQGPLFDFTHPTGGSSPTLVTPPITAPAQFWLRVTGACGTVNVSPATITPATPTKRRAAGH